jgi:glycosyltransferase involved in cell wall biosynthesis
VVGGKIRKLSVIIPNFNHSALLGRAIASHLAQTHDSVEIIIVDDSSTDDSVAVAEKLCREHSTVRLIRRHQRGGPNAGIATGLAEAIGQYVCFSAADDFVDSAFAAKAIESLEAHPNAAFCFMDPSAFHERAERFERIPLALAREPVYFGPDALEDLLARNSFTISSNTVIYRRNIIAEFGGFPPHLEWQADWFTNMVLGLRYGACYRPEALAHFTVSHAGYGASGVRSAEGQKRLLFACLDALENRFPDVAPRFRRAALVPEMRMRTLFWLLSDSRGRRFLTPKLAALLIAREAWTAIRPLTPTRMRRWLRRSLVVSMR